MWCGMVWYGMYVYFFHENNNEMLSCSIVMEPANDFVLPLIEVALPEEYKKWARPVLKYSIRSAALSIAWWVLS